MRIEALDALASAIEMARELLVEHGDEWTVPRLSDLEARLKIGDESAIISALSESTGGAGSLNDRVLSRENGDKIEISQVDIVNKRLFALVRQIEAKSRAAAAEFGIALLR